MSGRILLFILEISAVFLVVYLILLPFLPMIKYNIHFNEKIAEKAKDVEVVKEELRVIRKSLPLSEYSISPNRVIIKKIGVNAPIVESASAEYGLSQGAWHVPKTSSPGRGGNTVITGHRFKYLPPNNLTFYLFHKLEIGDIVSIIWKEKDYFYRVKEIKIVPDTDLSILKPTKNPTLTMFTCHPIYSTEKRLVVVSELIEE
ncbi:class D sortase [Candidatus Parcubacteria bacterium]|nr:class D sortase [Candidatus Parcubacteria bacterium]